MTDKRTKCPKCGSDNIYRDEVDVGFGGGDMAMCGPYGCEDCAWSEDPKYDFSDGRSRLTDEGHVLDQFGGLHPKGSYGAKVWREEVMTDNKEQFEGVRAEIDGLFDETCLRFGNSNLQADCSTEALAEQIRIRWNAFPELSRQIVSTDAQYKQMAEERVSVDRVNSECRDEITRLKEENEGLSNLLDISQGNTASAERSEAIQENVIAELKSQLKEAQSKIENITDINETLHRENQLHRVRDANAIERQIQPLQERIKELETPDLFHNYKNCEVSPGHSMLWELMENTTEPIEVIRFKELGTKWCVWVPEPRHEDESGFVLEFDTLEEAQKALKEGGE